MAFGQLSLGETASRAMREYPFTWENSGILIPSFILAGFLRLELSKQQVIPPLPIHHVACLRHAGYNNSYFSVEIIRNIVIHLTYQECSFTTLKILWRQCVSFSLDKCS